MYLSQFYNVLIIETPLMIEPPKLKKPPWRADKNDHKNLLLTKQMSYSYSLKPKIRFIRQGQSLIYFNLNLT